MCPGPPHPAQRQLQRLQPTRAPRSLPIVHGADLPRAGIMSNSLLESWQVGGKSVQLRTIASPLPGTCCCASSAQLVWRVGCCRWFAPSLMLVPRRRQLPERHPWMPIALSDGEKVMCPLELSVCSSCGRRKGE